MRSHHQRLFDLWSQGWSGCCRYCGTKFAVRALSEGLRHEVNPYNIRDGNFTGRCRHGTA